MPHVKRSNIVNILDKKTEKKIKKKVSVLFDEYIANTQDLELDRPCVVETQDGSFHKTHLSHFNEQGLFCSKSLGHHEFFSYSCIKNIF